MTQEEKKQAVARAALEFVEPGLVLGVGSGSTTNCFIDLLAPLADRIDGAVSSSEATAARLAALLLPPELAREVPAGADLLVVPNDALSLLPFAALPTPGAAGAPPLGA